MRYFCHLHCVVHANDLSCDSILSSPLNLLAGCHLFLYDPWSSNALRRATYRKK